MFFRLIAVVAVMVAVATAADLKDDSTSSLLMCEMCKNVAESFDDNNGKGVFICSDFFLDYFKCKKLKYEIRTNSNIMSEFYNEKPEIVCRKHFPRDRKVCGQILARLNVWNDGPCRNAVNAKKSDETGSCFFIEHELREVVKDVYQIRQGDDTEAGKLDAICKKAGFCKAEKVAPLKEHFFTSFDNMRKELSSRCVKMTEKFEEIQNDVQEFVRHETEMNVLDYSTYEKIVLAAEDTKSTIGRMYNQFLLTVYQTDSVSKYGKIHLKNMKGLPWSKWKGLTIGVATKVEEAAYKSDLNAAINLAAKGTLSVLQKGDEITEDRRNLVSALEGSPNASFDEAIDTLLADVEETLKGFFTRLAHEVDEIMPEVAEAVEDCTQALERIQEFDAHSWYGLRHIFLMSYRESHVEEAKKKCEGANDVRGKVSKRIQSILKIRYEWKVYFDILRKKCGLASSVLSSRGDQYPGVNFARGLVFCVGDNPIMEIINSLLKPYDHLMSTLGKYSYDYFAVTSAAREILTLRDKRGNTDMAQERFQAKAAALSRNVREKIRSQKQNAEMATQIPIVPLDGTVFEPLTRMRTNFLQGHRLYLEQVKGLLENESLEVEGQLGEVLNGMKEIKQVTDQFMRYGLEKGEISHRQSARDDSHA